MKREVVEAFERAYLDDLLMRHAGNVTAAAQHSGMLRSALQRLLRKYDLRSAEYRRRSRRPSAVENA
jgi:DNA-binding NtrC family response regulator